MSDDNDTLELKEARAMALRTAIEPLLKRLPEIDPTFQDPGLIIIALGQLPDGSCRISMVANEEGDNLKAILQFALEANTEGGRSVGSVN